MSEKRQRKSEQAQVHDGRWTAEVARSVLAAPKQAASGESVASFARSHGLQRQRLLWWRKRLAEWQCAEEEGPSRLVPAIVSQVLPAELASDGNAQVSLRVGAEVRIDIADAGAVSPSWVAALVRELGARR